jgi:hypothetical protein
MLRFFRAALGRSGICDLMLATTTIASREPGIPCGNWMNHLTSSRNVSGYLARALRRRADLRVGTVLSGVVR